MSYDFDFYRILRVSPNASYEEIRTAYRKLARQYHPDLNPGNPNAEETFKLINVAYEVLKDRDNRKKYDFFRQYGIPTPNPFARDPTEIDLENLVNVYLQELDKIFQDFRKNISRSINRIIGAPFRFLDRAVKAIERLFYEKDSD